MSVVLITGAATGIGNLIATGTILKEGAGIMPGGCGCPRCWWDSLG